VGWQARRKRARNAQARRARRRTCAHGSHVPSPLAAMRAVHASYATHALMHGVWHALSAAGLGSTGSAADACRGGGEGAERLESRAAAHTGFAI
jgi:hypothetical protein